MAKYVKVSDFYYGEGWYDAKSKLQFKKSLGTIEIPDDADMSNINRYMKFNYLVDVTPKAIAPKEDQLFDTTTSSTPNQLMQNAYAQIEIKDEIVEDKTEAIVETISEEIVDTESEKEVGVNAGEVQEETKEKELAPKKKRR